MINRQTLRDHAARQIRVSRPDLVTRADDDAKLIQVYRDITAAPRGSETAVVCVLSRFDPVSLIRSSCAFAAELTPARAAAWRRSFTRTIFLAGNPRNLVDRFAFAHVGADGSTAWTEPSTMDELITLRRLLKLFESPWPLPAWPVMGVTVTGPAAPRPAARHHLYVTTDGVSAVDCLVHLNHLLVDAVFDGVIAGGDQLVLRQVPRLIGVAEPFEKVRVGIDLSDSDRLRAYAGLSTRDRFAAGRAA